MIVSQVEQSSFWLWQLFGRLHPLAVHFPIALLCVLALIEIIYWKKTTVAFRSIIHLILLLSVISAGISVVFGLLLAHYEEAEGEMLDLHKFLGIGTFVLSLISLLLFQKDKLTAYRYSLFGACLGVSITGHYGAMLTHGESYLSELFPSVSASHNYSNELTSTQLAKFASLDATMSEEQLQELNLEVRTILAHNCYSCHGEAKKRGGLRLDSKEALFAGGEGGPIIIPNHAAKSELIRRITLPNGHKELMPTKGKRLSDDQVALLKLWIDKGAPWPTQEKSIYRVADLAPRLPNIPSATATLHKPIDLFVNNYFQQHNISWSNVVEDRVYIRRIYLDIIGLLPTYQEIEKFVADTRPNKREIVAKELLARDHDYAQHWLTFWNDLLRNDYSGTGYITGGRHDITQWLYSSLENNKPYNWFVKELISPDKASAGFIKGIQWRGTINSSQSTQMQAAQNVAQVFMGLNLKCASCHDSFISDWKLEDAFGFATIFADSALEIHRCDQPIGKMAKARVLYPELGEISVDAPTEQRLRELADFLVQPKDGRLYRTLVNRIWAQLLGRGIVEPVDEMDRMPWSEDLIDWLAYDFVETGYDIKQLIFKIVTSQTYQLPSVAIQDAAELTSPDFVFKGSIRRRLSAEQFADAISATFSPLYTHEALATKKLPQDIQQKIPFVRASLVVNDPFLTALGRPNRETVSTSRPSQANLLQALELTNGTLFYETLKRGSIEWKNRYTNWDELIQNLYRNTYGRLPSETELKSIKQLTGTTPTEEGIQDLVWAIALSPELQFIY